VQILLRKCVGGTHDLQRDLRLKYMGMNQHYLEMSRQEWPFVSQTTQEIRSCHDDNGAGLGRHWLTVREP
jgi:hypothetical protein